MPALRGQYRFGRQRRLGAETSSGPSTCVQLLRFEIEEEILRVTFTDGSIYEYDSLDKATFEEFKNASSRGRFFNSEIRNNYGYTRVG